MFFGSYCLCLGRNSASCPKHQICGHMRGNKSFYHTVSHFHRRKRKLLTTKITDVWTADTCKKPFVSVRRIPKSGAFYFSSAFLIFLLTKCISLSGVTTLSFSIKCHIYIYFTHISKREQMLKRMLNLPPLELSRLTPEKSKDTSAIQKPRKRPQVS